MDFTRLTPDELHEEHLADVGQSTILLDVREVYELATDGLIAGSLHIPMSQLNARIFDEVPQETPVIVYCAHGHRSYSVAAALVRAGWQEVYDLEGGIDRWMTEGYPIEEMQP